MGDEDEFRAISDSSFKRGGDLVQILRRNRDLDELQLQIFALFALTQGREHARVILSGGENFVARFEVHAVEQNLERLGRVARDRDLFPVAPEQFGQAAADSFRLRLEDFPHRVSGAVFLFPNVTNERFGHDLRAGRDAAVVQVNDPARDAERVLNRGPIIFIRSGFLRRKMRDGFSRGVNVS